MRRALSISITIVLPGGLVSQDKQFVDPSPPEVHELAQLPPKKPTNYPELRFIAAPKPLRKDAVTSDWPDFLGPERNSQSRETRLLREFPKGGPRLVWSMRRGDGYASPVIAGSRLVFTHREGKLGHIDCVHAETGQRFWRTSYRCEFKGPYIENNGPRSTPTISEGKVYVHTINGILFCLELSTGRTIWKRDLTKDLGTVGDFFGVVSTPLIVGDMLIQNLSAPKGPTVAGFDKNTGKLLWGSGTEWAASCSSPVLGKVHGKDRVFVLAGGDSRPPVGGLMVLDPRSGAVDFSHPFRSKIYTSVCGASPLVGANWVFLTSSYGVGSSVLHLTADGKYRVAWKKRSPGMQFSNPVLYRGNIYAIDGTSDRNGAIVCFDPKSGEELGHTDINWDETIRVGGAVQKLSSSIGEGSLLVADGDVLCLGDNGHLLWLDVTPKETKVTARASLFRANESWTPLVISRGLLYACQNNDEHTGSKPRRLLCYDLRAPE